MPRTKQAGGRRKVLLVFERPVLERVDEVRGPISRSAWVGAVLKAALGLEGAGQ